jgi:hypothetical protein
MYRCMPRTYFVQIVFDVIAMLGVILLNVLLDDWQCITSVSVLIFLRVLVRVSAIFCEVHQFGLRCSRLPFIVFVQSALASLAVILRDGEYALHMVASQLQNSHILLHKTADIAGEASVVIFWLTIVLSFAAVIFSVAPPLSSATERWIQPPSGLCSQCYYPVCNNMCSECGARANGRYRAMTWAVRDEL